MSQPVQRNHSRAQLHKVIRVESFRAGCGEFIGMGDLEKEEVEKPGWAVLPEHIRYQEGMFAVRAKGTSMLPKILDGDWCFFIRDLGGTRLNRIVLVEHRIEGMDRYSLKRYESKKTHSADGTWEHSEITLHPLNHSEHKDIILLKREDEYRICGWFVGRAQQIQRASRNIRTNASRTRSEKPTLLRD